MKVAEGTSRPGRQRSRSRGAGNRSFPPGKWLSHLKQFLATGAGRQGGRDAAPEGVQQEQHWGLAVGARRESDGVNGPWPKS